MMSVANQVAEEYDEMLNSGEITIFSLWGDRLLTEREMGILINEKWHSDLFFAPSIFSIGSNWILPGSLVLLVFGVLQCMRLSIPNPALAIWPMTGSLTIAKSCRVSFGALSP
jgi:hypothetical protein